MGTHNDMRRRLTCQRVDDENTRDWLQRVCDFIFKGGKGPESQFVRDTVIHRISLTPTQVRYDMITSASVPS